MILTTRPALKKTNSLNAQIRDAEQQLLKRRQIISAGTDKLLRDIHEQMTAPASLLLASGIGFMTSELSLCPTPRSPDTSDRPQRVEAQDVKTTLNLIISAYTLYNALPIAWLRKYFHHASGLNPAHQVRLNRTNKTPRVTETASKSNV